MMGNRWLYRFDYGRILLGKRRGNFQGRLSYGNPIYRPQSRIGYIYSGIYILIVPYGYDCPKRFRRRARGQWRQLVNSKR